MAVLLGGNVYGQDNRKTVAVVPATGADISQSIKDGVTEGLLEGVVKSRQFRPVARDKDFEQALREAKFQQSGFVEDNQLVQLGKALRADYVCYASINKFSEKEYRISYKMIDVATAVTTCTSFRMASSIRRTTSTSTSGSRCAACVSFPWELFNKI